MRPSKETAVLTVAAIRKPKDTNVTEYLFNERQQIFTQPSTERTQSDVSKRLTDAHKKNLPVKVVLDPNRGVVEKIETLSDRKIEEFAQTKTKLEKPDKIVSIDVSSIDPTKFNLVDQSLKFATFKLCTRTVPNYKKAKEIFDFCAEQSCHLPGPPAVTPCIPFQYVRDGCYARAHKMRKIIEERYKHCCEKVFSFANQNNDRLAVRANKWGGCCVTWWYHVAPLIRVKIKIGSAKFVLAHVIDPSMFDEPVLLSSWLSAQETVACSANAKVSMYSIQPGSAYTPANYQGTAFSTDPAYASTNATLTSYKNFTTCP